MQAVHSPGGTSARPVCTASVAFAKSGTKYDARHPLYYYAVYCYAYEYATNEAIFILCNEKGPSKYFRYNPWALTLLQSRSAGQTRAVEGICRTFDWAAFEMPELSFTEEELIEQARDWDWAILHIHKEYRLEKLDAAGLLYDFSQDEYWTNRNRSGKEETQRRFQ